MSYKSTQFPVRTGVTSSGVNTSSDWCFLSELTPTLPCANAMKKQLVAAVNCAKMAKFFLLVRFIRQLLRDERVHVVRVRREAEMSWSIGC